MSTACLREKRGLEEINEANFPQGKAFLSLSPSWGQPPAQDTATVVSQQLQDRLGAPDALISLLFARFLSQKAGTVFSFPFGSSCRGFEYGWNTMSN